MAAPERSCSALGSGAPSPSPPPPLPALPMYPLVPSTRERLVLSWVCGCGLSGCAPCPCPRPSGRSANPTAPLYSSPCQPPNCKADSILLRCNCTHKTNESYRRRSPLFLVIPPHVDLPTKLHSIIAAMMTAKRESVAVGEAWSLFIRRGVLQVHSMSDTTIHTWYYSMVMPAHYLAMGAGCCIIRMEHVGC